MYWILQICICVCMRKWERERARNKKVCERWCLPLYTHTSDKLSVLFCAASDAFHLFRARRQKSVLGKWRAWICLPGTRWDCVIIVGSWRFFFSFLFFETVSVKTLMSAYFLLVPERKHQFIMVGKRDEVCFDNNVSSKSVCLWNICQYFPHKLRNTIVHCFFSHIHILLLMRWRLIFFRIKNENKGIILPHLWIFSFFTYNLYIICDLFESVIYNLCDYDISIMFWSTYVSPIIPDVQKKRFINSNSVLFIYKSAISAHKDCYTPQCLWNRRKPFPVAKKHVSFYP